MAITQAPEGSAQAAAILGPFAQALDEQVASAASGLQSEVNYASSEVEESDFAEGSALAQQLVPNSHRATFELIFGKTKYLCIEASEALISRVREGAEESERESVRLGRKLEEAQRALVALREAEEEEAARAEREQQEDALITEIQRLNARVIDLSKHDLQAAREVVATCVRGWSNPSWPKPHPACSPENLAQLSPTRAQQLGTAILQRGITGRAAARFPG